MVTISTSSLPSSITSYPHLIGKKVSVSSTQSLPQRHTRFHFRSARISAVHATSVDMPRPHIASPYDVLGVHAGATCQEIKQAYRRLARVSHPDVASSSSSAAADEFIRIHAAYATLSDPAKRADYDRAHFMPRRTTTTTMAAGSSPDLGFSRFNRRRWETDQCW